ncbi:MAG: type II secretion system protein [Candidatus Saccharimonas sp.]
MSLFTSYPHPTRKTRQTTGFTIVELLIVIVVIAILAAISIVSYNGIQERAQNVKTEAAVAQYEKALAMYLAEYGQYPTPTSSVCLGEVADYPNGCYVGVRSSVFADELRKVASLPPPPVYKCFSGWGGCRYNFTFRYASTWKVDGNLHPYYVIYFLDGNATCRSSLEGAFGDFSTSKSRGYMESRGGQRMCVDMLPMPA